jgi:rubrerythrin
MSPADKETLAALTAGIQSEIASYVFYREASRKTDQDEVKEILEKLAIEEKQHFQILERQYDSLVRSEKWITTADALRQEGLPEIDEDMSQKHQNIIDEVAETNSLGEILDIALRLELEARDLFQGASNSCDSDAGRKMFTQLAGIEEGHAVKIKDLRTKYC